MRHFLAYKIPHSHLVDVFEGTGWERWSRILVRYEIPRVLRGEKILIKDLYMIVKQLKDSDSEIVDVSIKGIGW